MMQTIEEELVEETIESRSHTKMSRPEALRLLRDRDGNVCAYPDCGAELDFSVMEGPFEVTIDHWIPQWFGKENDWSWEEIWDLSNLKLMHKKCNARKGDRVPNADGTLPPRKTSTFRFRREKRATRPEACGVCDNGHELAPDEVCASCGANAKRYPRWAKVRFAECDHAAFWCWVCSITPEMRPSAVGMAVLQGESGEWDDE